MILLVSAYRPLSMRRGFGLAMAGLLLLTACSGMSSGDPSPVLSPKLKREIHAARVDVQTVRVALGLAAKHSTQANIDELAQIAQQAHDDLKGIAYAWASDSGGGTADTDMFGAITDLQHAMGALVAYAGTPNPATLASFRTQYQQGVREWNSSVTVVWAGTAGNPPTLR